MEGEKDLLEPVGSICRGFRVEKYRYLEELDSTLVEAVHERSGARVLHIANDDVENLFCLAFQTLPKDSSGVAHILEHTVLCGSRKFPVKDPFFAMTRRSLNTYMNALTGQDFTCYPAASCVEKDFYNLLEVYMDAVFHPELKKVSFLQEGHRLEFKDPKDPKSPLCFQGVVYNEMKGAMGSIESRMWEALFEKLTPDLPYRHNSGGSPEQIPSLSYEKLLEFHKEYYHPSRCLFFFYGNLPLSSHLEFIEKELENVEPLSPLPPIEKQKRFSKPIACKAHYPIEEKEESKNRTTLAFSFLSAPLSEQEEILALLLLDSMLFDTDASLASLPLLQSGLCTSVESSIDTEMSEVPWTIVFKGCDEKNAKALERLLFDSLQNIRFPQDQIEASLHQLQFERMEIGMEGMPFGLTLFFRSALLKLHGCEPEMGLLIDSLFTHLKQKIQNPDYLPSILNKYLIKNPHFVRLDLIPDPKLGKKEAEKEREKLKKIRKDLSEKKEVQIIEEMHMLKAYQGELERQSFDCLPKIGLKDISSHAKDFPLKKLGCVYHHDCFTNHILYADLFFDLPPLNEKELSLISLLTKLLPELGAGGKNYEETLHFQQSYLGNFTSGLYIHPSSENPNHCSPTLTLSGRAIEKNAAELFQLFRDYSFKIDWQDRKRIRELLLQFSIQMQEKLTRSPMGYATLLSLADKSFPAFLSNEWYGFAFHSRILEKAKNPDDELIEDLKSLSEKVLSSERIHLALSCPEKTLETIEKNKLINLHLPERNFPIWPEKTPLPEIKAQAHPIASRVAFSCAGMKAVSYQSEWAPSLYIASELMSNLVLHKEIREKGGAYGSGAQYHPDQASFHFFAFRDPHLKRSLDAFDKAITAIASGNFSEQDLEEAKLGCLQAIDSPVPPGNRAKTAYFWHRSQRDYKQRDLFRKNLMKASSCAVVEAAQKTLLYKEKTIVSFLGKDLYDKEQKDLSFSLPLLSR